MKQKIITLFCLLAIMTTTYGQTDLKNEVVIESTYDFEQTISALKETFLKKGFKIFAEINHSDEAEKVGLKLTPTRVLIVGNPKVGTLLMQENPLIALQLPLKILIYEQKGKNWVVYEPLSSLNEMYLTKNMLSLTNKIDNTIKMLIESSIKIEK